MSGVPLPPTDLQDLASRVSAAPLQNAHVWEELNEHLWRLRDGADDRNTQLVGSLDGAATLMRSLVHLEDTNGEAVRDMVLRLLAMADEAAALHRLNRPPHNRLGSIPPELPRATSQSGLAMINGMAIGEVMVRLGLITEEQVEEALRRQSRTGKKFGETLVELGISMEDVAQGLRVQAALTSAPSKSDAEDDGPIQSILLGEILIGMRKIDRRQLERGLDYQRETGIRIGAALVALGIISWSDVNEALQEQARFAAVTV